jgi:predicted enzyme related to lactoylglutathione lyase
MYLGEVCLCTNDVLALAGFYKKLFGLVNDNQDEVHQTVIAEGVTLTVYNDGTYKNNQNQNICLAFTVDDVDQEYERLKTLGVTILEPPTTRPWGARNMHFIDPDGNHIFLRCTVE